MEYPEISRLSKDVKSDIYVCAMGFEDRSLQSNVHVAEANNSSNYTLVLKYDIHKTENSRNRKELESTVKGFSRQYHFIDYSFLAREEFYKKFEFKLTGKSIGTMTINISSMTSHALAWILNYALEKSENTRIIYTSPRGYFSTLSNEDAFSSGVREVFSLKEFQGAILPGYPLVAIILLGYDFLRAQGILHHIQAAKSIGIIPTTGIDEGNKISEIFAREHERRFEPYEHIYHFNILDWQSVLKNLVDIRESQIERNNISLILDGAKIHSIAGVLFAKKYRDIQLVFSIPVTYFPNRYSYGAGETYELNISKEWLELFLSKDKINE